MLEGCHWHEVIQVETNAKISVYKPVITSLVQENCSHGFVLKKGLHINVCKIGTPNTFVFQLSGISNVKEFTLLGLVSNPQADFLTVAKANTTVKVCTPSKEFVEIEVYFHNEYEEPMHLVFGQYLISGSKHYVQSPLFVSSATVVVKGTQEGEIRLLEHEFDRKVERTCFSNIQFTLSNMKDAMISHFNQVSKRKGSHSILKEEDADLLLNKALEYSSSKSDTIDLSSFRSFWNYFRDIESLILHKVSTDSSSC